MATDPAKPPGIRSEPHAASPIPTTGNRLAGSASPYLLQHAHNPVEWYPWGFEALARAKQENRPIFLSIGYSACHWCHVMEREVFEKPTFADIMNANFVNIKVDREERPDLDELYMLATQLTTGQGGWPMSVWLTPELEPFYAGTYFPPEDGYGRPGFGRLCLALAQAWRETEEKLRGQARRVVEAVTHAINESTPEARREGISAREVREWISSAIEQFADRFDDEHGGLGSSPKFPPSQAIHLWLELLRHGHNFLSAEQRTFLQAMLTTTLDAMMRGGIYDQVGGGFARYSTDACWLVPHFEKMLYDNGQLAGAYALAGAQMGRHDYQRIARGILDFWLREMTSEQGAFYSTLDADSQGVEGKYYVWTTQEIRAALGPPREDDAELIVKHLGVTLEGNWHEGGEEVNVLHVAVGAGELGREYGITAEEMQRRLDGILLKLREARQTRVRPGLDDKILTGWNGLMISGMAMSGHLLKEPRYLEAAHRAIGFVLLNHMKGRTLLRVSRAGQAGETVGFLEDHAYLLNGLMDLIDATVPTSLPGTMARKRALEMADALVKSFEDPAAGGFYFSGQEHEKLFARIKNATDAAVPAANGVAIRALLRLARVSGNEKYRQTALRAVAAFRGNLEKQPFYFATILQGLAEDLRLQAELPVLNAPVVAGEPQTPKRKTPHVEAPKLATQTLTLAVKETGPARAGETFDIVLVLNVAEGFHVQPHVPDDREAFATVARARGDLPLAGQEWHYPEGGTIARENATVVGYQGEIVIRGRCIVATGAKPGSYTMRVTVLAQPCTDTYCLAPEKVGAEFKVEVM